jgi:NAD-reducing hydrogenase small subunit
MSFLDMDERLLSIAEQVDLVYSPLMDRKDFLELVDITLVEGAVSSEEDLTKIKKVRAHTNVLVSLGDCAITSNVPGMRNLFGVQAVLNHAYIETAAVPKLPEYRIIPRLLDRVRPIHEVVPVDVYLPGCPPPADLIFRTLLDLIAGRTPQGNDTQRFGA